ncbi:MAG TPA: hypothetical protein VE420_08145, partial [Gemmatimonadales bacterium]|nr:hypothetical protein [Gemmatimonadales bacterium]
TDDNVFNQMARTSNGNELQLGRSQGNFRASSCQFRRIVVDAGFSNEIMQGNRPEPYRSCHLSNCLFVASLSQVLAAHITLDAGRFQPDNTDAILLTGVSTTAIYTGNASPNRGIRLVAGVPGGIAGSNIRHAANLFSLTNP